MDYEDFLVNIYTPLKSIELLTAIIYDKYNNEWDFSDVKEGKMHEQELLSINFLTNLTIKHLLTFRKDCMEVFCLKNYNPSDIGKIIC